MKPYREKSYKHKTYQNKTDQNNTSRKKRGIAAVATLLILALTACAGPSGSSEETDRAEYTESSAAAGGENLSQKDPADKTDTTALQPTPEPEEELSLKELFAQHGMKVGTCLNQQMTTSPAMSKLILSQFNSVTMENAMKPDYSFNRKKSIAADDLVVEFKKEALDLLEWAKKNGMGVRGHTLVWYSQTPEWIFHENYDPYQEYVSRDVMLRRMESYIRQVFAFLEDAGYSDILYAYDVANEAWMEDGSLRENNWTKTIGDDYLWYAFSFARQYAPEHVDLYYNDYNEQFKYDTFVQFVDTLKDEDGNSLIDGVGFQAHLYTQDDLDLYFQAVDAIAATGLKLELTELDICLGEWQRPQPATEENLREQGQFCYELISGLFDRVDAGTLQMDALTFWGVSDNLSWRSEYSPLLYDKFSQPKYAYYGAMQIRDRAGY